MSLLRRAEQCFANQQTYKALNAFVPHHIDRTLLQQRLSDLKEAERRSLEGNNSCIAVTIYVDCLSHRMCKVSNRRTTNSHQGQHLHP